MFLPSGDQTGCVASVETEVSLRASPPSEGMTQTWKSPPRFDSKAIHWLSGDQVGCRSCLGEPVSRRGVPPSAGTSQMSLSVLFAALSTSVAT